ncbi:MAG: phosphate ABC transporter permease PstA [Chloroflexota bacterium]
MSVRTRTLPADMDFKADLARRQRRGRLWQAFFFMSIGVGILALVALLGSVIDEVIGYRAVAYQVDPLTLTGGRPLEDLSDDELLAVLNDNMTLARQRVMIRDRVLNTQVTGVTLTQTPMRQLLAGKAFPEATADRLLPELTQDEISQILALNLGRDGILDLINDEIVGVEVLQSWTLSESLFQRGAIEATVAEKYPGARLEFGSWLTLDFLTRPMSSTPAQAGIRTALLGTLWLMVITIAVAFPIGVGAAIYLEEYAGDTRLNRIVETNIRNLAGVPSIIYGLLGLAVFVRALSDITGGRSVLAAGLTMALLVLPVIIINAQEAIRAVPSSLREASYGLGATQWQTIWNTVLPAAMPGILTGTILASSRAIGETAPLIVVGASTLIFLDPTGPTSMFTALPIQIYDWTKRPDPQFRDIAAATIVVLLAILLSLNAFAIILRQRFKKKLQG